MWLCLSQVWTQHREVSSLLSPQCEPRAVSGPSSDLWSQAARAWGPGGGTGGGEGGNFDSFVPTSWAPGSSLGGCLPRGRDSQGVGEWVPGLIGSAQPGHAQCASHSVGIFISEKVGQEGRGRATGA